jgi:hypothetical protein
VRNPAGIIFVRFFIDNGVSVEQYLTCRRLLSLYEETFEVVNCSFNVHETAMQTAEYLARYLPSSEMSIATLPSVGLLLKRLIGQFTHPLYMAISESDGQSAPRIDDRHIDQPYNELFIWAVVSNRCVCFVLRDTMCRTTLALELTKHIEEPLQTVLAAMSIARRLSNKSIVSAVPYDSTLIWALEQFVVGVMEQAYDNDQTNAIQTLHRPAVNYNHLNCLQLASLAKSQASECQYQPRCCRQYCRRWSSRK